MRFTFQKVFTSLTSSLAVAAALFSATSCTPLEDSCPNVEEIPATSMNHVFVQFYSIGENRLFTIDELGYVQVENLENDVIVSRNNGFYGSSSDFSVKLPLNLNNDVSTYVFSRSNGLDKRDTVRFLNYDPRTEFLVDECQYVVETNAIPAIETNLSYFQYEDFNDQLNVSSITFYF